MKQQLEKVEELIRSEVNIKEIEYLSADNAFIHKKIKPNFILLGKKLGAKMKAVSAAFAKFSQEEIIRLEREGKIQVSVDDGFVDILLEEADISSEDVPGWMVAAKGPLTVALDVTVTPELEREGHARELVNRIQKIRKDKEFDLTDRITVQIAGAESLNESIREFNYYICAEILADRIDLVSQIIDGTLIEVNDVPLTVLVTKKA